MKNVLTYNVIIGCFIIFSCISLSAQDNVNSKNDRSTQSIKQKRVDNYMELRQLGYEENEIFEDLGNANFLAGNYSEAMFWYNRLKEHSPNEALSESYLQRYTFAKEKLGDPLTQNPVEDQNWLAMVKADYGINSRSKKLPRTEQLATAYNAIDAYFSDGQVLDEEAYSQTYKESVLQKETNIKNDFEAPISLTADGKTAFFSKTVSVKPSKGIFSKKEKIHKIYRADKINGEWQHFRELKLCPKYYSAAHPTVSYDGKRLFFASDMPGTYGEFDIYVTSINNNGTYGLAKNLGAKVNTKKNDMYPSIIGKNTLFFASEGRDGFGGLDVYMAQVDQRKVGLAINLGSPINSSNDDFSISFKTKDGMGFVMSNRGASKSNVQQVAFSYDQPTLKGTSINRDYSILEALNNDLKMDYSSSVFEDE